MIIKNFTQLAITDLRKQALLIAEAGLEAVNTRPLMRRKTSYDPKTKEFEVCGQRFSLAPFKRVILVGCGKMALDAASEVQALLKDEIKAGYVIDAVAGDIPNVISRAGTHPYPSTKNTEYTHELVELLKHCTAEDLVIAIVGGGASSLLFAPPTLSTEKAAEVVRVLIDSGANPDEIITVRKHLSSVKGGQLAAAAYPATIINLLFSDVPEDDPAKIGGGPTVYDPTTAADAQAIIQKYNLLEKCNLESMEVVETPKDKKYFERIHNVLVCTGHDALEGMLKKASDLGFSQPIVWSSGFVGVAEKLGPHIVATGQPGQCLLGVGKAVIMGQPSHHMGGRNQEMALAAMPHIPQHAVLLTLATEGEDNSPAAGAIVDQQAYERAQKLQLDVVGTLERHDCYGFFQELGASIETGVTGSNVADLVIYIRE